MSTSKMLVDILVMKSSNISIHMQEFLFVVRFHPIIIQKRYWTTHSANIDKNQAMMRGFLVAEFADGFKEASKQLAQWVQENKIKTQVSVEDGFDKVPQAFRNLLTGDNFGKQVIKVANE